jgi:membrane protein implicated in regulation of membrane protease activity
MSRHRSGKRPWLAAVLAFIYPGLGHAYLREWLRALLWFGLLYMTAVLAVPASALPESGAGFSLETIMAIVQAIPTWASLVILVLSVLNIADAYRLARQRDGRSETVTENETNSRCPHCGHETDAEFDFCQWCGEPLDASSS